MSKGGVRLLMAGEVPHLTADADLLLTADVDLPLTVDEVRHQMVEEVHHQMEDVDLLQMGGEDPLLREDEDHHRKEDEGHHQRAEEVLHLKIGIETLLLDIMMEQALNGRPTIETICDTHYKFSVYCSTQIYFEEFENGEMLCSSSTPGILTWLL